MNNSLKNFDYEKYYKQLIPYLKKEKNQKYFYIILTISASIFFTLFAISPTLSTIIRLGREIDDGIFVNEKLTQKVNNLSALSVSYNDIENDLPFLFDAIPKSAEAPNFIGQVQSLAQEHSVTFSSVNISPINFDANLATTSSSFTFELGGTAGYENFYNFVSDLANMQRFVVIDGISITKDIEGGESLNITIKGAAYYKN